MGRRSRLFLLIHLPAIAVLTSASSAQVRTACPSGTAPQGVVVAVGGDVTARSQAGNPFDVSVGTVLCPLDQITTGSRSRVEFRLAGKDTTTGTSNNAVTVIPEAGSDCVTLLDGILALISSVRGRHCVRTPFIDAGIEGTEAVVAVDGPTGDLFVLVRAGEVGVVDRRGARRPAPARSRPGRGPDGGLRDADPAADRGDARERPREVPRLPAASGGRHRLGRLLSAGAARRRRSGGAAGRGAARGRRPSGGRAGAGGGAARGAVQGRGAGAPVGRGRLAERRGPRRGARRRGGGARSGARDRAGRAELCTAGAGPARRRARRGQGGGRGGAGRRVCVGAPS